MKFCLKCGSEIKSESQFCHTCGEEINWMDPEHAKPTLTEEGNYADQGTINQVSWTIRNDVHPDQTNFFNRVKNILLNPKEEWTVILAEQPDSKKIILNYVSILALIPTLSTLLGYGLQGHWMTGIREGLVEFLVSVISVLVIAWIVDLLAPSFQSEVNFGRSLQLVAYSFSPGLVAGILSLIPSLSLFVFLISLYSIYLIYTGIPLLKKTPVESVAGYVGITFAVIIIFSLILAFIITGIVAFIL
jgi:hypothetical protein